MRMGPGKPWLAASEKCSCKRQSREEAPYTQIWTDSLDGGIRRAGVVVGSGETTNSVEAHEFLHIVFTSRSTSFLHPEGFILIFSIKISTEFVCLSSLFLFYFHIFLVSWYRVFLCSSLWLQTHDLSATASLVQRSQGRPPHPGKMNSCSYYI